MKKIINSMQRILKRRVGKAKMNFQKELDRISGTYKISKGLAECYLLNFKNNFICCRYNNGCKYLDRCKEILEKENAEEEGGKKW